MDCEGEAACRGDVIANITPEGIELRFPVECAVTASRRRRCLCVAGGELEEENQDRGRRSGCGTWRSSTGLPGRAFCR